ncbi:beta family protein [Pseudomonas sp. MHK4]
MNNYTPFLKTKTNEIGALKVLDSALKPFISPFFDFPMKKGLNEDSLKKSIDGTYKKIKTHLKEYSDFYLDNFDIPDAITIAGKDNYIYAINKFTDTQFIPVVAIERTSQRNDAVFHSKSTNDIKSDVVALRVQPEDFQQYSVTKSEIQALVSKCLANFTSVILILDNRICRTCDTVKRAAEITNFILAIKRDFSFSKIIVTGSSIPASIKEILDVGQEISMLRSELEIYKNVIAHHELQEVGLGDYTIVSPNFSEIDIPAESMRNVTAPKILYAFDDYQYVIRGNGLKNHPRGNHQYNDMAKILVAKSFYRTPPYSWGDKYLDEKANSLGSLVTPSSILNPTINAHITFMLQKT